MREAQKPKDIQLWWCDDNITLHNNHKVLKPYCIGPAGCSDRLCAVLKNVIIFLSTDTNWSTFSSSTKPPRAMLPRDSGSHMRVRTRAAAAAHSAEVPPQVVRHLVRALPPPRTPHSPPHSPQLHRTELLLHLVNRYSLTRKCLCTL